MIDPMESGLGFEGGIEGVRYPMERSEYDVE